MLDDLFLMFLIMGSLQPYNFMEGGKVQPRGFLFLVKVYKIKNGY